MSNLKEVSDLISDPQAWADSARIIAKQAFDYAEIKKQAHRYMVAVYGKDYVFKAPETFNNFLITWVWSVASGNVSFADAQMKEIERLAAERNDDGTE